MPTFIETLKLADRSVLQQEWLSLLRSGGAMMLVTAIVVVIALLWFFVAVGSWQRRRLGQSAILAFLGAGLGWVTSFTGYQKAVAVVEAAQHTPTAAELAEGANRAAFPAFSASAAGVGVIVLCMLAGLFVRSRRRDDDGE